MGRVQKFIDSVLHMQGLSSDIFLIVSYKGKGLGYTGKGLGIEITFLYTGNGFGLLIYLHYPTQSKMVFRNVLKV